MGEAPDAVTLSICGFHILVTFMPSALPYESEILTGLICSHYKGFIISGSKISADAHIQVADERHFTVIRRRGKAYTDFFHVESGIYKTFYHISLSQFTIIVTEIIQLLLKSDGFILHASGIAAGSRAYLFTGPSGAGKSTMARLLSGNFIQLADDSIAVRQIGGKFYAYQTPLIEKNTSLFRRGKERFPLAAVFILKKTNGNPSYRKVTGSAHTAIPLANQLWVNKKYASQMTVLFALVKSVPVAVLSFPKDQRTVGFMERIQQDFTSQPGGTLHPVQREH